MYLPDELATIYRDAASVIRTRGLAKETFRRPYGGAVCSIGALAEALDEDDYVKVAHDYEITGPLARTIGWHPGRADEEPTMTIYSWNDKPERTEEQVVAAFEETADRLAPRVPVGVGS